MTTDEKWLTKKIRERFTRIRLRSFESCRIASVPDMMAIVRFEIWPQPNVYQFWIEAKKIATPTSATPWSGGQEQWIREFEEDGGTVFILCLVTSTRQVVVRRLNPNVPDELIDLANPEWPKVLESLLIESL